MRRAGRHSGWAAVAVAAAVLAACSAPGGELGSSATAAPGTHIPTGIERIGCQDVRLVGPSGEPVNLTGLWGEPDTVPYWNVHQLGNCLFLVSLPFTDETDPSGNLRSRQHQRMCEGVWTEDFTIDLRCVDFASIPTLSEYERETWQFVFNDSGEAQILPCSPDPPPNFVCLVDPLVRYAYETTEHLPGY